MKLAQVKYLQYRLAQFKATVSNKFNCMPSVIVAGDFNSTPGDEVCFIMAHLFKNKKHISLLNCIILVYCRAVLEFF